MTTLHDWRHILANGVSAELSVPELPHRFRCLPYSAMRLGQLPCGLIQQGSDTGPYWVRSQGGGGTLSTLCAGTARFTLWLVVAKAVTEEAADLFDHLVDTLVASRLEACLTDPLNVGRARVLIENVGNPGLGEHGGQEVWWAPVHLIVPT